MDKALWELENNARQNGYYAKRNIASGNVKLWSVGMTASKTQAVNAKMMEVAKSAMAFANKVGDIAEEQGHHPDLHVAWGRCGVEIWTHKIQGLTRSDFILAARADVAFSE